MAEVVMVGHGGGGVAATSKCWELFCRENGIAFDGTLLNAPPQLKLYHSCAHGRVGPRCVLFDR